MATLKVTGDFVTLTSAITVEDFLKVKRYAPEAATLVDENGKEIFKIAYNPLAQEAPNKYGVEYGGVDFDGKMFAQFSNPVQGNHSDPEKEKNAIVERYANIISKLNVLESILAARLPEIENLENEVAGAIVIEGGDMND